MTENTMSIETIDRLRNEATDPKAKRATLLGIASQVRFKHTAKATVPALRTGILQTLMAHLDNLAARSLPENAGRHAAPASGPQRSVQNAIIEAEQQEQREARAAGYGIAESAPRRFSNNADSKSEMRNAQLRRRKKNQRKNKRARSPWQNGMSPIPTGAELRR